MSSLDAVDWSYIVANKNKGISQDQMQDVIIRMMVLHLHRDHPEYNVRKIARSLGIKEKQVKLMIGVEE